jgi:hypothetical protein
MLMENSRSVLSCIPKVIFESDPYYSKFRLKQMTLRSQARQIQIKGKIEITVQTRVAMNLIELVKRSWQSLLSIFLLIK